MFNSYKVTPKAEVDARTTNNLNFNAVSGTLCKSHPKSTFVWFQHESKLEESLMGANPKYRFDPNRSDRKYDSDLRKFVHIDPREDAIVLQIMLTGENRVIAEIVKADDFYELAKEVVDGD